MGIFPRFSWSPGQIEAERQYLRVDRELRAFLGRLQKEEAP
jgi:hypothetical protein